MFPHAALGVPLSYPVAVGPCRLVCAPVFPRNALGVPLCCLERNGWAAARQVTAFGKRATTAFARAEAKEAGKKGGHGRGDGDSDSSRKSHHFVWH